VNGDLQNSRLSDEYKARLAAAGDLFRDFCRSRRKSVATVAQNPRDMTDLLVQFIDFLHDCSKPLWLASHAILAMQTWDRSLRGQLTGAWDSVLSWKMERPVHSRVPMPKSILTAVAYVAVLQGMSLEPHNILMWLSFSVCVRVGFYALLRPKELFELTKRCLRLPTSRVVIGNFVGVCTILDPKNRAFMGRLQARMIKDTGTLEWLLWYCAHMNESQVLWPYSDRRFSLCLYACLKFLGLDGLSLTPASLRAGGATEMLESGVPVQNIKFAGSWASDRSLACYLQEAEAAATLLSLTPSQVSRLEQALDSLHFLDAPPSRPFCCFDGSTKGL